MIENYECLQQPLGSNSCLPTIIRAILLFWEEEITQEEASEWCGETEDGCFWPEAIDSLRREGYRIEELVDRDQIIENVENEYPVAVNIVPDNRLIGTGLSHAVVILNIDDEISYHDPASGDVRTKNALEFWQAWDFAGGNAFILEP